MQTKWVVSIIAGATLLGGGAFVSQVVAAPNHPPIVAVQRKRERHPEIRKAMKNLEQAKTNLQNADRDFGGHRTKAVEAINVALDECKAALAFDKH